MGTDHAGPSIPRPVELNREIASYIRDLIMSGQLPSESPINMDQMARQLNISTTPVREALQTLRGEGFVQFEPRRGFRIAPLRRGDVEDLFMVQAHLAGELAARAADRMSPAQLEAIQRLQSRMDQAANEKNIDEIVTLNFAFHSAINHAADSPKLAWLLSVVVRYVPRRFYAIIPGWVEATIRDHQGIIQALNNSDSKGAQVQMDEHIRHAGKLLMIHLENQSFWSESSSG